MNRKKKIMLSLLGIIIVGVIVYQYPIQKAMALKSFESYINKQGVATNKIASKEIIKDWKRGGYLIVVTFNDDQNNKYYYHYETWSTRKGENLKFNRMTLSVIDEKNSVELDAPFDGKCKYPPIEE